MGPIRNFPLLPPRKFGGEEKNEMEIIHTPFPPLLLLRSVLPYPPSTLLSLSFCRGEIQQPTNISSKVKKIYDFENREQKETQYLTLSPKCGDFASRKRGSPPLRDYCIPPPLPSHSSLLVSAGNKPQKWRRKETPTH